MIGQLLVGLIAVLHVYILVLEMFLWDKPAGLKAFANTLKSSAHQSFSAEPRSL